ncbi:glucose-6-phosphate dehydrogenase [Kineococcus aurantiacus]|uniref:Glucose-6-phosphate 1-dehydrogenase n=1 Tax=Kineococcus aurantiacus TaxID=37633 RepID=A0A7Y9DL37_9ACTN|nr:glucose-6-phosphate dehydrogenase [Kineococcus aurantiacus]NYD22546.1 glucose-6-phosphate 1-dehydrogenase [Kineococcus aurantiacus]
MNNALGATTSAGPTVFVVYGASGDLAKRLVMPGFAALAAAGLLPDQWVLIGSGRRATPVEQYREHVRDGLQEFARGKNGVTDEVIESILPGLRFAGGGFTAEDPGELLDAIAAAKDEIGSDAQVVHYLALPPTTFVDYTRAIAAHGLAEGTRVVYEKPYGTSPQSFEELDRLVLSVFEEQQVFRIDHFLGKEATQQLHVIRFANRMIEQLWSNEHVAQVQIDVPEVLGVDDRATFYDETGATLDMLVTHLLQVAAEVALDPPADWTSDALATAREAVLAKVRPIDPDEVVLGQAVGYQDLEDVRDGSSTDTFVAARVWVDTERWSGVPFVLRTGKKLAESHQHVTLVFKRPLNSPQKDDAAAPETLTFTLSGNGSLFAGVTARRPGVSDDLVPGNLYLDLADLPNAEPLPPYAALLRDVLIGDRALFTTSDGLRDAWRVAAPMLDCRPQLHPYEPGTWGPAEAEAIAAPYGWLTEHPRA